MNRITPGGKFKSPGCVTSHAFIGLWVALCMVASSAMVPLVANANPYLTKPGEAAASVRAATCATSGGFMHIYTALDNNLFDKYGIKASHIFIRGSSISLASLSSDEIQFLYCAAAATIPGMATGIDGTLIGAPLVGLPYVLITRKDIKKVEDLKGHSLGVTRAGDLSFRLSKVLLKQFNLTEQDVKIRPIGGSQRERYQATLQDVVQGIVITPPLEVQGRKDGLNVVFHMNEINMPFIYSSLHTNSKNLKERPGLVQRFVAAMAESIHFVEKNPDKAKASLTKTLKIKDQESLQSAYDAYAKSIINRRMLVPADGVKDVMEFAEEQGTKIKRKAEDLYNNSFAENLEKSGFLKEIWGGAVPGEK